MKGTIWRGRKIQFTGERKSFWVVFRIHKYYFCSTTWIRWRHLFKQTPTQ